MLSPQAVPTVPVIHCPSFRAECAFCERKLHGSNQSGVCVDCQRRWRCCKCGSIRLPGQPCHECTDIAAALRQAHAVRRWDESAAGRPAKAGLDLEALANRAARQEALFGDDGGRD